jgi:hypothetical protein
MAQQTQLRGIIFILLTALAFLLACSFLSSSTPVNPPASDPTKAALEYQATAMSLQLTQAALDSNSIPAPTPTGQVESQPTLPPATSAPTPTEAQQRFFTEDFDAEVTSWTTVLTSGEETLLEQRVDNGFWIFDLGGKFMFVYSLYQPETYADVRIDARAENRGDNTNNISIICRYDEDEGWYEFNMYNSGLYDIFWGRWKSSGTQATYVPLADGGSNAIHQGKAVNDYTVICKGNTLSLFINGDETRTINENQFVLREGKVGIGVSSFDRLPIRVDFDSVKISEP